MATLQIDLDNTAPLTPEQSLAGWRRELCVEVLGQGNARIFLRNLELPSSKAAEQQRGILFHRVDPTLTGWADCIEAIRPELDQLVDRARRTEATQANLYSALVYDRAAWERVQQGIDRWSRRRVRR